ncbi:hypothetical protein CK203_098493 [Vitis vinifera]|uniref:Reverse transcriptase zinc-binding domain-containing protein n=1 Tax=Vitis vinifera TaxID=29760 RepID=A0A438D134_VITVI|nr:hypothetical protein CK203_098493 [Vitis vinifera]
MRLRLEKIQRDFLWGGGALVQKPHLVRWNLVCLEKGKAFLEAIISHMYGEEKGGWCTRAASGRVFNDWEIELVERFLHKPGDSPLFPSGSIWSESVPPKVAFFAWEASWGKVLTLEQLQRIGY